MIRDRFPDLSHQLVEAYGEANAKRCKLKEHRKSAAHTVTFLGGAEVADTTKSTKLSDIFDEPGQAENDGHPLTSLPSLSTAAAATKGWRPRVPNLPEKAFFGESFTCLACGKSINNIDNRRSWKEHIFADLRPYSCTFPKCKRNNELFQSRAAWVEHETTHVAIRRCPFCPPSRRIIGPKNYYRHVAIHLREVSLAVITEDATVDELDDSGENSQSDVEVKEEGKHTEVSQSKAEVKDRRFALMKGQPLTFNPMPKSALICLHGSHGPVYEVALIDTGSLTDIITMEVAKQLVIPIQPTDNIQLKFFGGMTNPLGEIILHWSFAGNDASNPTHVSTFLIHDKTLKGRKILIGLETLKRIKDEETLMIPY
ncbi:MAG: hypothetical protein LQ351_007805 [Letrouitia transgressa]|nr:MAG: hypothetical protein LQ351_007805 [Letrouitia transgressa]